MTQERRRYGFVLERQCSLAKHWISYHTAGKNCLTNQLDNWDEIAASREFLPPNMENMFGKNIMVSSSCLLKCTEFINSKKKNCNHF